MGAWDGVKSVFAVAEKQKMGHDARGRSLFSPLRDEYSFGDVDERGNAEIARFAAQRGHHSEFDFMPAENRVYFTQTVGG